MKGWVPKRIPYSEVPLFIIRLSRMCPDYNVLIIEVPLMKDGLMGNSRFF